MYSNLDDRTREVYRENVQMAEALSLHMEHEASLRKTTEQLEMANRQLIAEKELNQQLVKEKIAQSRQHKKLIRELQVGRPSPSHTSHTHCGVMVTSNGAVSGRESFLNELICY